MRFRTLLAAAALTALAATASHAQDATPLDSALLDALRWRSIGPANMSGRISDVEGIPSPSKTFFIAAATGGIWKTTNNGTTFRPVFDNERVSAFGDLAIAPSDTMQVWAGTGEEDSRNSISPGRGIYKSTDGGLTWTLMGLEQTETIGRIVVHPTNPDIVWVAALGAIWRSNPERGLYKTTDGGRTWRLVKFVSDQAGFVDLAMDPRNPDVLFASSWQRVRGPYFLNSGGPGSALWKSADGGETWTEVTGGGLPTTMKGRIGIAIAPSDPRIMYLNVEAANDGEDRKSGLYRSQDGGQTWEHMNTNNVRPFYYSQVRVHPTNPDRVYWSSTPVNFSDDGGRTVRQATLGIHVDHHAMWIDPNDPDRHIVGNDGGIAISFDGGGNYIFPNSVPLGQFYAVSYDMAVPYRVCGGLQDNYSWCGPSRKSRGEITNHDWFMVSGGDGFVTAQDPRDPNIIYSESQGGNMRRLDYASGESTTLQKPNWRDAYRPWQDSIALIWPDTTRRPSAEVQRRIDAFRRSASEDSAAADLRYNWNTPFFLSPHDPDVFYAGANRVLRSSYRGDSLQVISPDLSKQDMAKIRVSTETTGGITRDATGAETYGTIVSLTESPVRRGMIIAGTDDGNVWITLDDGAGWTELTAKFQGLVPDTSYVSRIEASPHDANRFYVAFDNHRNGDFTPYVFMTEDGGESFRSIASNLPTGGPDFVHVVREDPVNPNLLFVGTDVGVYTSLDRGGSWQKFMTGLPTVPVHDLEVHPRDRELMAGTHGRSIWIVDIAPLQQLTPAVVASNAHLFEPKPGLQFGHPPTGGEFTGQLYFQVPSLDYGAEIAYWIGGQAAAAASDGGARATGRNGEASGSGPQARIVITDSRGDTLSTLEGPATRGLHRVVWDFRAEEPPPLPLSPSERRDSIATEARLAQVVDSLARAGTPRARLDSVVSQLRGGEGGGGGFGGGRGGDDDDEDVPPGEWRDRPAESPPPRAGGQQQGQQRGQQGGGEQDLSQTIVRLVRGEAAGGRGRGRFGGGANALFPRRSGGPAPLADPGTYTVTLTVGERTMTETLTVVRGPAAPTR